MCFRGLDGRNQGLTAWVSLLSHSCILFTQVMFLKLQNSSWWPVQLCYRLGPALPGAYMTMNSSSSPTATETPPSYLAQLDWQAHETMVYLFQEGTFSSVLKSQQDLHLASFKERSKLVKFTQGKVSNYLYFPLNN